VSLNIIQSSGALLSVTIVDDEVKVAAEDVDVAIFNSLDGTAGVELGNVLADSGQLAAATKWDFTILADVVGATAVTLAIERRDAANTSTLQEIRVTLTLDEPLLLRLMVSNIIKDERIRITLQTEIAVGDTVNTTIRGIQR